MWVRIFEEKASGIFFGRSQTCKKLFLFCRWAQQWSNIGDILKPYPGKPNLNVTGEMLSQVRIFIYCENENLTCPTEPGTILSQELHKAVSRDETSFCTPHISAPFSTLIKYHVRWFPGLEPEEDVREGGGLLRVHGARVDASGILGGKHPRETKRWKVKEHF